MITVLKDLARQITQTLNGRQRSTLVRDTRALRDALLEASDTTVREWLVALRQQPGTVRALSDADLELVDVLEDVMEEFAEISLGDVLRKWVDQADISWLDEAADAAEEHHERFAPNRDSPRKIRIYANTGNGIQRAIIQLRVGGVPGVVGDTMLWSERATSTSDPVALAISLAEVMGAVEFIPGERPPLIRPKPLDRYHPERFANNHPGVRSMYNAARANGGRMAQGVFEEEDLQRLTHTIVTDMNPLIMELPHEGIAELPSLGSAPAAQSVSLASHLLMWVAAGRQIYDLPPALAQRFRQTDVDDVPLSMLKYPYDSLYVYWGAQSDLELEPGWLVDGAYVQSGIQGRLQILVTAAPSDPMEGAWWPIKGEPYYYQLFDHETMGMDVGTAVDTALSQELTKLRERASAEGIDLNALMHEAVASGEIDPGNAPLHIKDVSARTAKQEIERLTRRHVVYLASLKLAINGLCYLTAYPDDSAPEYSADAPEHLIKATTSTDFKTAKSARGRLAELGYLPVHLCGRELMSHKEQHGGDRHLRSHWRRGHWRRQAYGEGRALRKLIWVMPMVVGANEHESEPLGHLYLVS